MANTSRRSPSKEAESTRRANMDKARDVAHARQAERATTSRSFLQAIVGEIDVEDVKKVVRKLMEQAMEGDPKAREWLGKYAFGNGKMDLREIMEPSILKRRH